jgi:hypothetical protein
MESHDRLPAAQGPTRDTMISEVAFEPQWWDSFLGGYCSLAHCIIIMEPSTPIHPIPESLYGVLEKMFW